MAKLLSHYLCSECHYQATQWSGQCPDCGEWNSFSKEQFYKDGAKSGEAGRSVEDVGPKKSNEISSSDYQRTLTGISEFDRVVGGGLVEGSLVLIGGEPGIGKSTLLTEIVGSLGEKTEENILYISGEESQSQIASRVKRLKAFDQRLYIYNQTNWQKMLTQINRIKPKFLVVDSIQTTQSSNLDSAPGTSSQIREVTYELMTHMKAQKITTFVIGHITKEGAIAGPKILEHMVDTVIYFEGDQKNDYRLLRAIKNRFGNTNEVGLFEMKEEGLFSVSNPSKLFTANSFGKWSGRSLTCITEGSRSLFVEIQSLITDGKYGVGKRTTQGLDSNRLSLLVAICEKHCLVSLGLSDVFINIVGGIKLDSRESDLAVIASLLSSLRKFCIPPGTIFIGEVGLTGEIRASNRLECRLKECQLMGYNLVFLSEHAIKEVQGKFPGLTFISLKHITELNNYFTKETVSELWPSTE
ncbi:MAG: DNA repair protein RadA [Halobacteriovoraceae bacterium]|jgi:DNA repair protein RadA/Sms|nr:DNA repair protein RadA [Halobacteriovoraceae bacterium]MBT5095547.1 DNA repair protein RadA [Halobacteriovoraceae bacterium]